MLRGTFIAGNIHVAMLNKGERSQTNNLIIHIKAVIKAEN